MLAETPSCSYRASIDFGDTIGLLSGGFIPCSQREVRAESQLCFPWPCWPQAFFLYHFFLPAEFAATKRSLLIPGPFRRVCRLRTWPVSSRKKKRGTPPTIVYVGLRTLFAGGHIAGASFHGTASEKQGLTEMKKWAEGLPRSTNLVIYCGCCPFEKCPNIRPAFTALRDMGFNNLRVLVLPTNFATDWAGKGYPMEKGM